MNTSFIAGLDSFYRLPEMRIPGSRKSGFYSGLKFLQKHYHKPIKVSDLVKAAAMSHRGLHKAFCKFLGRTPGRELRHARIERAKKLLIESNRNIKEIPKMCGFKSLNTFEVAFKQITGMSPGKFRTNYFKNSNSLLNGHI